MTEDRKILRSYKGNCPSSVNINRTHDLNEIYKLSFKGIKGSLKSM